MSREPVGNRIIDYLPDAEFAAIRPALEAVSLELGDVIYAAGEKITKIYFPTGSVLSALTVMSNGAAVEIGTFGFEGLTGAQLLLSGDSAPSQIICQIAGNAQRMRADVFLELIGQAPMLRRLVYRYTEALFNFMGQSIACNRLHTLEERCARWLLLTHDRVHQDSFGLKQDFLALMLGVQRPSVSLAASTLQKAGFIRYSRGHVEISDRAGLESASCECYQVNAREFHAALSKLGSTDGAALSHPGRPLKRGE